MELASSFRPHRILRAVLLFAILATASVAAAGVSSEGTVASGPMPPSLSLPPAQQGDRGTYVWDRVALGPEGDAAVLASGEAFGFEWLAPEDVRDRDGVLHATNTLAYWSAFDQDGNWTQGPWGRTILSIDATTRKAIATTSVYQDGGPSDGTSGLTSTRRHFLGAADRHAGTRAPCGLASPLLGGGIALDAPIDLLGPCAYRREAPHELAALPFKAMGAQAIGGRQTVLFTHAGDAGWFGSASTPTVHVWIDPAYPVPVRMAVQDGAEDGLFDVYRLASFARGQSPVVWNRPVAQGTAPGWVIAPLVDGLPDETGIEHPFSARTALQAARATGEAPEFFRVLDDGFLRWAYLLEWREQQDSDGFHERAITWVFLACDGIQARGIYAAKYERTEAAGGIPPVILPPRPAPPEHEESIHVGLEEHYSEACTLRESDYPDTAPTVASMLARWKAFASPQLRHLPGNHWNYDRASHRADAGHLSQTEWHNATATIPFLLTNATTKVLRRESILGASYDAGRASVADSLDETVGWDLKLWGSASLGDPRPATATAALRPAEVALTRSTVWVAPAAPIAAATSLAALLVAIAYLLWPALKSGGLAGLFSRVRSPEAEQAHPVRRAVLDLVAAQPGIHVRDVQRRLGLGRNQVDHHVRRLVAASALRAVSRDGYSCLFLRGAQDAAAMNAAPALKADAARRILAAAVAAPGIGARELARQAGLSPGTVSHHLRRMREAGLLAEGAAGIVATELGRRAAAA